jgi:hypothetical protein
MTRLKRLDKGLVPLNWNSTTAELRDLVELTGKARPSVRSTYDWLLPARTSHMSSQQRRAREVKVWSFTLRHASYEGLLLQVWLNSPVPRSFAQSSSEL